MKEEKEYQIREIKFDTGAPLKTLDVTTHELTEKDDLYSLATFCYSCKAFPNNKGVKVWALFFKDSDGEWKYCRSDLSDELENVIKAQNSGAYFTISAKRTFMTIAAWLPELSEGKPLFINIANESYEGLEWCTEFFGLKSNLVRSYMNENIYKLTAKEKKEGTKNNEVLRTVETLLRGIKLTKAEMKHLEKDVLGPIKAGM